MMYKLESSSAHREIICFQQLKCRLLICPAGILKLHLIAADIDSGSQSQGSRVHPQDLSVKPPWWQRFLTGNDKTASVNTPHCALTPISCEARPSSKSVTCSLTCHEPCGAAAGPCTEINCKYEPNVNKPVHLC